jgi:hypothetical protein
VALATAQALNVSECQILCYDPTIIPDPALLQPKLFTFFLSKDQFPRVQSKIPAAFKPAFTFEQHPGSPSQYDHNEFCLLDQSPEILAHFPFPEMREFKYDLAQTRRPP